MCVCVCVCASVCGYIFTSGVVVLIFTSCSVYQPSVFCFVTNLEVRRFNLTIIINFLFFCRWGFKQLFSNHKVEHSCGADGSGKLTTGLKFRTNLNGPPQVFVVICAMKYGNLELSDAADVNAKFEKKSETTKIRK